MGCIWHKGLGKMPKARLGNKGCLANLLSQKKLSACHWWIEKPFLRPCLYTYRPAAAGNFGCIWHIWPWLHAKSTSEKQGCVANLLSQKKLLCAGHYGDEKQFCTRVYIQLLMLETISFEVWELRGRESVIFRERASENLRKIAEAILDPP